MSLFEEKGIKTTPISAFGEFALIDHLTKDIEIKNDSSFKGVGDDAAVIEMDEKFQLVSTDLLLEKVERYFGFLLGKHIRSFWRRNLQQL